MLTLEDLKARNLLEDHVQLVTFDQNKYVEFSKYRELAKKNAVDGLVPVCDNPQWIAVDNENDFVYSKMYGNDKLGKVTVGMYDFRTIVPEDTGFVNERVDNLALTDELKMKAHEAVLLRRQKKANKSRNTISTINKTQDKEGKQTMERPKINMGNMGATPTTTDSTTKVSFGAGAPNVEQPVQPQAPAFVPGGVAEQDESKRKLNTYKQISAVAKFNKANKGCLKGLIVKNDAKIDVSAVSPAKKKSEKDNGSGAAQAELKKLEFKQSAPGTVTGAILSIPEGGFLSPDVFNGETDKAPINQSKTDLVDHLVGYEDFISMSGLLFGSVVPECPATYGAEAATTDVSFTNRTFNRGKVDEVKKKVPKLTTTREIRKVVHPNAYLPLKTYDTILLSNKMDAQAMQDANTSLFYKLFHTRKSKGEYVRTIESLEVGYVAKLNFDEKNLQVSSEYISPDGIHVNANHWYTGKELNEIRVVRKEMKVKEDADGRKVSQRAVTVNVLGKVDQPKFDELNSTVNPDFANFRDAVDVELSVSHLVDIFKGSTDNKKKELLTSSENMGAFMGFLDEAAKEVKSSDAWISALEF